MNRNLRASKLTSAILIVGLQLLLRGWVVDALLSQLMDARTRSVICGLWWTLGIAILRRVCLRSVCRRPVTTVLRSASVLLWLVSGIGCNGGLAWVWVVWGLVMGVAGLELDSIRRG